MLASKALFPRDGHTSELSQGRAQASAAPTVLPSLHVCGIIILLAKAEQLQP